MRQVQPIRRTFRFQLQRFTAVVSRNWLLRRILFLVRRIHCLITCQGEIISAHVIVTVAMTILRVPDVMARRTIVRNTGAAPVVVFESGKIIAEVAPGESKELLLAGRFVIEGRCISGETTTVEITTYRRCACGDPYIPPYGQAVEPIGGDLI